MCSGCFVMHCEGYYCWKHHTPGVKGLVKTLNGVKISDCIHERCPECHGTGIDSTGRGCVHAISCPCDKCRTYC